MSHSNAIAIEDSRYDLTRCWTVIGSSAVRRERAVDAVVAAHGPRWRVERIIFKEKNSSNIIENLQTGDLFSPYRICLIRDCESAKSAIVEQLCASTLHNEKLSLGFVAEKCSPKAAIRTKVQEVIELKPLKGEQLHYWTTKEFQNAKVKQITPELIQGVISLAEENPDRIAKIIEQLLLYCPIGTTPTIKDLKTLFPLLPHVDEFKLIEIIASASDAQLSVFISLLGKQESNFFGLLGLLFGSFSQLQKLAEFERGRLSLDEMCQQLGKPQWLVRKQLKLLHKFNQTDFTPQFQNILTAALALRRKNTAPLDRIIALGEHLRPDNRTRQRGNNPIC